MLSHVFKRKPVRSAILIVQRLFQIIDKSDLSYKYIAKKAGIRYETLRKWKFGYSSPRVQELENVAEILGYEICLRKAMQPQPSHSGTVENISLPEKS